MKLDLKFSRKTIAPDLGSGLTVALVSIPEGMAYAMVAGVNPIYGLYTGMVTTIVAALTGSTNLMIVTLTNALALVTADALAGCRDQRGLAVETSVHRVRAPAWPLVRATHAAPSGNR